MPLKRKAKRTPTRLHHRYSLLSALSVLYEGATEEIPVRPPDLSTQGMFINTPTYFPQGAVLRLRFRLGRSDFEVCTRAEVRYCLAGIGIGVEFLDLPPEARRAIEQEMEVATSPGLPDS